MLASDELRLRTWLETHPEGHERAAMVLLRRFDRWSGSFSPSPRYVVVEVIPMTDEWIIDSSPTHVNFLKGGFQPLYHRCAAERLVLCFVHNHPAGPAWFSGTDDQNETQMVTRLRDINEADSEFVALLLHHGRWYARVRSGAAPAAAVEVRHVVIAGDRLDVQTRRDEVDDDEVLARQEAAFGKPFTAKMGSLRFCVVGAGGTGSPTATLLARSGAGELIIVDNDKLETTNLNRGRGARRTDVGKNKARALADYVNQLGLRCKAVAIEARLQTPDAIDALSSADVVVGCTDSESSRDVMNLGVHYYGQLYIDTGLGGSIALDERGLPALRTHTGRVNVMTPEFGRCLYCHRVITDDQVRYEDEVERRPWLKSLSAEQLLAEHYLRNSGGEQSPGVGPFTSATADYAVMSLLDMIKPFRRLPEDVLRDCIRQDFVGCRIYSNEPAAKADCVFCQMRAFRLKDEKGIRLGRPALGRF
jgi:hypothetical protein